MTIGIIGLGYVGLPLAVAFAEAGERVIGLDSNATRVDALRNGRSHVEDISDERLQGVAVSFEATTLARRLALADAILVCVPTPLTPNREPDLGPLMSAATTVADVLQRGQVIVFESTTYPGTTRERVLPVLEETGLKAGTDFHLAFSPERVDPGRTDHTMRTTPKIVGGLTPACTERAVAMYSQICDELVPVSTPEIAEMAKLLENIFRSVNIALVNEMAELADRMGIDIWEVVDAAATKPYGFMRFDPGPGMGGHCLPVDPFYLSWKAREYGMTTEFIELAGKVNQHTPYFCVEKIERALNDMERPVRGSKVLILGVSYKPAIGDVRESPALKIIERLRQRGADVRYHDPYVAALPREGLSSTDLDVALADSELAVIVTAHPGLDYRAIAKALPIVDLRGVIRHLAAGDDVDQSNLEGPPAMNGLMHVTESA
jgi:UDP-N-acetyl-D-glucosamine dehydrogenase